MSNSHFQSFNRHCGAYKLSGTKAHNSDRSIHESTYECMFAGILNRTKPLDWKMNSGKLSHWHEALSCSDAVQPVARVVCSTFCNQFGRFFFHERFSFTFHAIERVHNESIVCLLKFACGTIASLRHNFFFRSQKVFGTLKWPFPPFCAPFFFPDVRLSFHLLFIVVICSIWKTNSVGIQMIII